MRRLPFVLWLLGWPALYNWDQVEDFWRGQPWSTDQTIWFSLFHLITWIWIARLLWTDESNRARVVSTTTVEIDR